MKIVILGLGLLLSLSTSALELGTPLKETKFVILNKRIVRAAGLNRIFVSKGQIQELELSNGELYYADEVTKIFSGDGSGGGKILDAGTTLEIVNGGDSGGGHLVPGGDMGGGGTGGGGMVIDIERGYEYSIESAILDLNKTEIKESDSKFFDNKRILGPGGGGNSGGG